LREGLRRLDADFLGEPTAIERRRPRIIVAVFVTLMIVLPTVLLRDGISVKDLADNWPSLRPMCRDS